MKKYLFFWLVFILLGGGCSKFPRRIRLEYVPREGSNLNYLLKMTSFTTVKSKEATQGTTSAEIKFTQTNGYVDVNGNTMTNLRYNEVHIETIETGGKRKIPFGREFEEREIILQISPRGKIMESEGIRNLHGNLKDYDLRRIYFMIHPVFLEGKVRPGRSWEEAQSWTTQLKEGMVLEEVMTSTYTWQGFSIIKDYRCAVLDFTFVLKTEGEMENMSAGIKMKARIKSVGRGTIEYAYRKNRVVSCQAQINSEGEDTTTANGKAEITQNLQKVELNLKIE